MKPYALIQPSTLQEASAQIAAGDALPLGGGTALMLMMKAGVLAPGALVALRQTESQWRDIALRGDLHIGALVTLAQIEQSEVVRQTVPALAQAMTRLSNVRVRNVATLGGHLAHGDPHMDLPPVMIALDAELTAVSVDGERNLRVADLFTGYYETALAKNELISEVRIPSQAGRRSAYLKCTTRTADDWPALGVAVSFATDGKVVRDARVVVSAATEKAVRLRDAEAVLEGATVSDAVLTRAGEAAAAEAEMVGDARGSAAYKREMLRVYAARAVKQALAD